MNARSPGAVVCDLMNSSTLPLAAPASRTDGYSATSDRERASRLRSAPVAISHGPDLGRRYFDGGCPMPATSAVEPRDVPVGQGVPLLGPPVPYFARSTGATGLAAITDDAEAATAGEGKGSACAKPGQPPSPANLSMADAVAAIALEVPDFHTPDHDRLPKWDPERAACATCMSDEQIAVEVAS